MDLGVNGFVQCRYLFAVIAQYASAAAAENLYQALLTMPAVLDMISARTLTVDRPVKESIASDSVKFVQQFNSSGHGVHAPRAHS